MDEVTSLAAHNSPEALLKREYSHKSDVWSFGVLLYELMTGKEPFEEIEYAEVVLRAHNKELELPRVPEHPQLSQLMKNCMTHDPASRFVFDSLLNLSDLLLPPSANISQSLNKQLTLAPVSWELLLRDASERPSRKFIRTTL